MIGLPQILTQEEVVRLIDAAELPFYRILLMILYGTSASRKGTVAHRAHLRLESLSELNRLFACNILKAPYLAGRGEYRFRTSAQRMILGVSLAQHLPRQRLSSKRPYLDKFPEIRATLKSLEVGMWVGKTRAEPLLIRIVITVKIARYPTSRLAPAPATK